MFPFLAMPVFGLPVSTWFKLAGAALLAIAIGFAVMTVVDWKNKAAGYDTMKGERDKAIADKAQLVSDETKYLGNVSARLDSIDRWRSDISAQIQHNGASIDAKLVSFKKATANAHNVTPGSADDQLVRDRLRELLRPVGSAGPNADGGKAAGGSPP
jgi:hypothetical protein